jgi:uncharacterized protein YsxB (DUF464 family)
VIVLEVRQDQGAIAEFTVRGHAQFAQAGSDIVCAAVSILVYNAINSCERFGNVVLKVVDDGKTMRCLVPKHHSQTIDVLLSSMVYGVEQIADQYPDHVSVRFR